MNGETAPGDEYQEFYREAPLDVLERLVKQGELEVVTTASGTILYIPQHIDE